MILFVVEVGRIHGPALTSTGIAVTKARKVVDMRNFILGYQELYSAQLFQLLSSGTSSHLYRSEQSEHKHRCYAFF